MEWAYHQTEKALEFTKKGKLIPDHGIGDRIQAAINYSNKMHLPKIREWVNG
jgi:hypothetical protein